MTSQNTKKAVDILYNFEEELEKYGLTTEKYEQLLADCSNKVQKINDLDWSEICAKYGLEFNPDTIRKGTQPPLIGSVFVSEYYKWKQSMAGNSSDDEYLRELRLTKRELEKERVKVRDERNELRRLTREDARRESLLEQMARSIKEHQTSPLEYDEYKQFTGILNSDNDLVVSLTDIHAGIVIDNFFNKYNEEVLKQRINQYLDKIFEVKLRHGSENVYVILSEVISGLIHNELRIESNQNVIDQFLMVTDYISQFLRELSYQFEDVNVYVCPGNHSRVNARKEESLKGENFDHLLIPHLEAKLQNFKNIVFHKNVIEESIAMFSVRGQKIFAAHGDKDSPANVVEKLSVFAQIKPDIVYLGHRHTNAMSTVYDTKVVQSGCLSGADNYCMDKRLRNKPEQTITVVTNNGLECLYDVKFN